MNVARQGGVQNHQNSLGIVAIAFGSLQVLASTARTGCRNGPRASDPGCFQWGLLCRNALVILLSSAAAEAPTIQSSSQHPIYCCQLTLLVAYNLLWERQIGLASLDSASIIEAPCSISRALHLVGLRSRTTWRLLPLYEVGFYVSQLASRHPKACESPTKPKACEIPANAAFLCHKQPRNVRRRR
jgi:hypothetical protein